MLLDYNLSFLIPTLVPLSIANIGLRKMIKGVYMEKYDIFSEMLQQRLFLKYMEDSLLNNSIFILKQEKKRRMKEKILKYLHINK